MELSDAIRDRRSVRSFRKDDVSEGDLAKIMEAASMAPSSMNSQPWYYHIARGELRDKLNTTLGKTTLFIRDVLPDLSEEMMNHFCRFINDLGGAPVLIVMTTPRGGDEQQRKINWLACGCSLQNLMLEALNLGYGTVSLTMALWVEDEIKETLGIGEEREIVTVVLVGRSDEEPVIPLRNEDIFKLI